MSGAKRFAMNKQKIHQKSNAGISLRTRLNKKDENAEKVRPFLFISLCRLLHIRYPEMAKNISTPDQYAALEYVTISQSGTGSR